MEARLALTELAADLRPIDSVRKMLDAAAESLDSPFSYLLAVEKPTGAPLLFQVGSGAARRLPAIGSEDAGNWATSDPVRRSLDHGEAVIENRQAALPIGSVAALFQLAVGRALHLPLIATAELTLIVGFAGRERDYTADEVEVVRRLLTLPGKVMATRLLADRERDHAENLSWIYDGVRDIIFTLAVDPGELFRFTSVNQAFLESTGLSREGVIGKDFREVIPESAHELVLSKYREAVRERTTTQWEEVSVYPAGVKYGEVTVTPVCDDDGICTGLVGTVHDLTTYREIEERARRSAEQYRVFVENSMDASLLTAPDGRILQANPAAREMFGLSEEEIVAGGRAGLVFPDDERLAHLVAERERTGRVRGELMMLRGDGTPFPAEISSAVFDDQQGNKLTSMIIRDITDRRRAREALEENERYFRALIDNATDLILVLSPEGTIRYASPSVRRLSGHLPGTLIGRGLADIARSDERAVVDYVLSRAIDAPDAVVAVTLRLPHADGSLRIFTGSVRNALGDPAVAGIIANLRDITTQERNKREQERLREQLQQAQKLESIGRLAGGVAHDFNNQLTVILGHIELVLETLTPGSFGYENLEAIRAAARRSADLTRQLLTFARRQTINPQLLDLNEAVSRILKMLRRLIGENIRLEWRPGNLLWPVRLDPVQVDQILANLCVNARDAIDGPGLITIETRNVTLDHGSKTMGQDFEPGEYVLLSVTDDGSGMDAETMSHIFEPFFTTKELGRGTGLGAATVYGIVRQNQGFITVTSAPGEGAAFEIYIPRYAATEEHEPVREEAVPGRGQGETLLLVEDDPGILETTRRILESFGYRVLGVANPQTALDLARQLNGSLDLLVTDVVMPTMNGKELSKQLTKISPATPTLFVSGYTADVIAVQGVLEEGMDFIEKPYEFDVLAKKIREILDR